MVHAGAVICASMAYNAVTSNTVLSSGTWSHGTDAAGRRRPAVPHPGSTGKLLTTQAVVISPR
jgi:hypothetical protein